MPSSTGNDISYLKLVNHTTTAMNTEDPSVELYNSDDELFTWLAFERPDELPIADLYEKGAEVPDKQEEQEMDGYPRELIEAMSGCNSSAHDSKHVMMEGNGGWEVGSFMWDSMPPTLEIDEFPCVISESASGDV